LFRGEDAVGKGSGSGRQHGPGPLSDQVIVNAPDDLNIRKLIIGQRQEGMENQQYAFYPDQAALQQKMPANGAECCTAGTAKEE
jgi:hypothetical protein